MNTQTDGDGFAAAYSQLAIATRVSPDREGGVEARLAYFDAMHDLPIAAVVEAAAELSRTARFFPTVAEWAATAERIVHSRSQAPILAHVPEDDPVEVAKARAARDNLVRELRLKGQVGGVDYVRLAEVFAKMPIRLGPAPHCRDCEDRGWAYRVCRPAARCGGWGCQERARDPLFTHDYVIACACRDSNPKILDERAKASARRTTSANTGRYR